MKRSTRWSIWRCATLPRNGQRGILIHGRPFTVSFRWVKKSLPKGKTSRKEIYDVSIADRTHSLRLRLPVAHQALASHPSGDGPRTGDRVSGYESLYLPHAAPSYRSVGKWSCRIRAEARQDGSGDGLGQPSVSGVLLCHPDDGSCFTDREYPPLPGTDSLHPQSRWGRFHPVSHRFFADPRLHQGSPGNGENLCFVTR